jgi:hypothetical protein
MPFAAAAEDLAALTQVVVSAKSVERLTHRYGQALAEAQQAQAEALWTESGEWPTQPPATRPDRRVASADGTLLHTRDEGWKEVKVGSAARFTVSPNPDVPGEQTATLTEIGYCAWLGTADDFAPRFWAELERHGVRWAETAVALSDAGVWVRQLLEQALPQATHIIDWYHPCERLWEVARAVFGSGTPASQAWGQTVETDLWNGKVTEVQAALRTLQAHGHTTAAVAEALTYFTNQAAHMNYPAYRQHGYPIGSGTVESACKNLVGARCTLSGMRWSIPGAQAVLALRAELLSQRWEVSWTQACNHYLGLPPI